MNVRNFFAESSRQALRLVKESMGPDALILSNRPVDGGVEIVAIAKEELPPRAATVPRARATAAPVTAKNRAPAPRAPIAAPPSDALAHKVIGELHSMRAMFEEQFARYTWDALERHDPGRAKASCAMLAAGFSAGLAREFLEKMPAHMSAEQALRWSISALERNLHAIAVADEIVARGGVYALVGPTGVGKTTTAAKIAARCVVRHGTEALALLTTDAYRIGAHEQLRIYGRLLGVKIHAVKDAADLHYVLGELRDKRLVLIDTVGMSQRDRMVVEQLEMLSGCGARVQRLLLLNATSNLGTLYDVVRSYRVGAGEGCIVTKIDEAVGVAAALEVVVRHGLTLHYVANGQRVPEDLHLPNRRYLVHRALTAQGEDASAPAAGAPGAEALAMSVLAGTGACLA